MNSKTIGFMIAGALIAPAIDASLKWSRDVRNARGAVVAPVLDVFKSELHLDNPLLYVGAAVGYLVSRAF